MKAWHFLRGDGRLRNGDMAPDVGAPLIHEGPIKMCISGLHFSRKAIDALVYAPGPIVCRVEVEGVEIEQSDKGICRSRTILWKIDATDTLRRFACRCALDVIHLWNAPEVVMRYLKTQDESIRAASLAASLADSLAASLAASRAASGEAAREASWEAAREASWAASWAASGEASWAAAGAAAWAASRARNSRRLTSMLTAAHKARQSETMDK